MAKYKKVYVENGIIKGSYDELVSQDDTSVVEVAVLEGEEEPTPVPTGNINITENGDYDVTNYASANVDVAGIQPTGTLNIVSNNTYDVTNYASASVNVPNPSTGTLSVNSNNVYDVTNYASVDVQVPNPSTGTLEITENDTYDVTDYASVDVSVAGEIDWSETSGTRTMAILNTMYEQMQTGDTEPNPTLRVDIYGENPYHLSILDVEKPDCNTLESFGDSVSLGIIIDDDSSSEGDEFFEGYGKVFSATYTEEQVNEMIGATTFDMYVTDKNGIKLGIIHFTWFEGGGS